MGVGSEIINVDRKEVIIAQGGYNYKERMVVTRENLM
jgi:hypothetical protein